MDKRDFHEKFLDQIFDDNSSIQTDYQFPLLHHSFFRTSLVTIHITIKFANILKWNSSLAISNIAIA